MRPIARSKLARLSAGLGLALAGCSAACAYVLRTDDSDVYVITWLATPITMQVKLSSTANLIDGNSQSGSVVSSMQSWNTRLGVVQFAWQTSAPGAYGNGNRINEIVMDSTIDGDAFSTGTLAVTVTYTRGDEAVESDIVINNTYTWDSYRGNLRNSPEDLQRVVIHELGHVLGLGHPDEHGQSVTALMNSHASNIDGLQADDISGAQVLYGAPGAVPSNDSFASASRIYLNWGTRHVSGSSVASTREAGEPNHAGSTGRHSIWWKWTPSVAGTATVTTLGSNFDTTLAVYTGSAVSALTLVTSNDDEETPAQNPTPQRKRTSKVTFAAVAGQTYTFAVDGWGSTLAPEGYAGAVTLNLDSASATPMGLAQLANISTRAYCSTGDNVTIGGFVVTGSGTKRVLVQAVGPTLANQGLAAGEVLQDPVVEVFGASGKIAGNDNWAEGLTAADLARLQTSVGATRLASGDSTSSVLLLTVSAGTYSFIIKGKNDASGIVLLEAYDLEQDKTEPKFFDIAARAYATTGNGVAIGGFVIGGTRPKQILMQAVGPALASQGLRSDQLLQDPIIELHRGALTIGENDNWTTNGNVDEMRSTAARVGATPFGTTDTRSSALLMMLDPGVYSFIAKGRNETSGIVLIEVYDAD